MATTKPKFINITTSPGTAIWPKLNAPDTKFKAGGEFAVRIKLSAEEAQPIIDKYEAELAAHFERVKAELMKGDGKDKAKAKALKLAADKPYKPEYDDEGEETGNMLLNFKMPHRVPREGKADLLLYPAIFDAAGKELKNPPEIWGGSKLVVAGQLRPFNTAIGVGLSMRLQAVQILELATKGSRDAAGFGFGKDADGYQGDDDAPPRSFGGADAGDDGNPADDIPNNPDF